MRRIFLPTTCLFVLVLGGCDETPLVCPGYLGIDVQPREPVLQVGESVDMEVKLWDGCENPIDVGFDWASSDSTVASVSETGRVTGVSPGSAIVEGTATGPVEYGSFGTRVEVLP